MTTQPQSTASEDGRWDHRYRRLEEGETIRATDYVQTDDGGWTAPHGRTIGTAAPDPSYTSHRIYRRLLTATPSTDAVERTIAEAERLIQEKHPARALLRLRELRGLLQSTSGREVERAYREGWQDGNNAGHSGKCFGADDDWQFSDARTALSTERNRM